jgi:hypothetical protein
MITYQTGAGRSARQTASRANSNAEEATAATIAFPGSCVRKDDKPPKRNRFKSAFRDAAFMQDLQRLAAPSVPPAHKDTLFSTPLAPSNSPTSATTHTDVELTEEEIDAILADVETRKVASLSARKLRHRIKKRSPWYLREHKHAPWTRDPLWRQKRPEAAPWRDTTDLMKVTYFHRALTKMGCAAGFTLRLNDEVQSLARQQPDPLNWLQERIRRNLTKALGWPPAFYVVLEETDDMKSKLHIHGELGLPHDLVTNKRLLANVRKALRMAGGQWPKCRQFQANLRLDVDEGWTSYIAKTFWKWMPHTRRLLERFPNRIAPTFKICHPMSVTADLLRRARAAYEADRVKMREGKRSAAIAKLAKKLNAK